MQSHTSVSRENTLKASPLTEKIHLRHPYDREDTLKETSLTGHDILKATSQIEQKSSLARLGCQKHIQYQQPSAALRFSSMKNT